MKKKDNEKFRTNVEEGRRNWAESKQGKGIPQAVMGHTSLDISSVFRCTALNAAEFETVFGLKPIKKWTRYLSSTKVQALCSETGLMLSEDVWLFSWDPASVYRTLEIRISENVVNRRTYVSPGDVCFQNQATMAFEHFGSKQSEGLSIKNLTNMKPITELLKRWAGAVEESQAKQQRGQEATIDAPPRGAVEAQGAASSSAGPHRELREQPSDEMVMHDLVPLFHEKRPAAATDTTPAKKQRGHTAGPAILRSGSAVSIGGDDFDDAASMAPSVRSAFTSPGSKHSKWLTQLNSTEELLKGNQGVLHHHAKVALGKMAHGSIEWKELSDFLVVFEAHQALYEKNYSTSSLRKS